MCSAPWSPIRPATARPATASRWWSTSANHPPALPTNAPPNTTKDGPFDLSLTGTAAPNATSVAYQVSLTGGASTATTAAQTSLADGDYQFRAVVTDPAGNSSTSNSIEVVVDNTNPTAGTLAFSNLTDDRNSTPLNSTHQIISYAILSFKTDTN